MSNVDESIIKYLNHVFFILFCLVHHLSCSSLDFFLAHFRCHVETLSLM